MIYNGDISYSAIRGTITDMLYAKDIEKLTEVTQVVNSEFSLDVNLYIQL